MFIVQGFDRVVASTVLAAAAFFSFGSNPAAADTLNGETYADASAKIAQQGATAVIATVSGDDLSTDECLVTSSQKGSFRDASGNLSANEVLVHLNCNARLAGPGSPGISAATPEGRAAKKLNDQAAAIKEDYVGICGSSAEAWLACKDVCDKTGKCEVS